MFIKDEQEIRETEKEVFCEGENCRCLVEITLIEGGVGLKSVRKEERVLKNVLVEMRDDLSMIDNISLCKKEDMEERKMIKSREGEKENVYKIYQEKMNQNDDNFNILNNSSGGRIFKMNSLVMLFICFILLQGVNTFEYTSIEKVEGEYKKKFKEISALSRFILHKINNINNSNNNSHNNSHNNSNNNSHDNSYNNDYDEVLMYLEEHYDKNSNNNESDVNVSMDLKDVDDEYGERNMNKEEDEADENKDKNYFKYEERFYLFIYPYKIYKVIDISERIFNKITKLVKCEKNQSVLNNYSEFESYSYLLRRTTSCSNVKSCQYLMYMPDNILLKSGPEEELFLHQASHSEIVLESRENGSYHLWMLNIKMGFNFKIFYAEKSTPEFATDHRTLNPIPVFGGFTNDSIWDMAFNGSSHKFVKVRTEETLIEKKEEKVIHEDSKFYRNSVGDKKIKIPKIFELKKTSEMNKSEEKTLFPEKKNTLLKKTIHFFEVGINDNSENRPFALTSFEIVEEKYENTFVLNKKEGNRVIMIGCSDSGHFVFVNQKIMSKTSNLYRIFIIENNRIRWVDEMENNLRNRETDSTDYNHAYTILEDRSSNNKYKLARFEREGATFNVIYNIVIENLSYTLWYDSDSKEEKVKGNKLGCRYNIVVTKDEDRIKYSEVIKSFEDSKYPSNVEILDFVEIGSQFIAVCYISRFVNSEEKSSNVNCAIVYHSCDEVYKFTLPEKIYVGKKTSWEYSENILNVYDVMISFLMEGIEYLSVEINRERLDKKIKYNLRNYDVHKSNYHQSGIDNGDHYYYKHHFYEFMAAYDIYSHESLHNSNDTNHDNAYYRVVAEKGKPEVNSTYNQSFYENTNKRNDEDHDTENYSEKYNCTVLEDTEDNRSSFGLANMNNTNISELFNETEQFCFIAKDESVQELMFEEERTFLEKYEGRDGFRESVAVFMLESKLRLLYPKLWEKEAREEQISNCQVIWKNSTNKYRSDTNDIVGISFGKIKNESNISMNNDWKVCRIVIDSKYDTLILEPDYENELKEFTNQTNFEKILNPYHIYRCSLQDNNLYSKCSYREWEMDHRAGLPMTSKSLLFIFNQGQTYNLKILNLKDIEMDKIASVFFMMFIVLLLIVSVFTCFLLWRPLFTICLLYLRVPRREPNFTYPLNCLEVKAKVRILSKQGILKINKNVSKVEMSESVKSSEYFSQENKLEEEEDVCIFCLQKKEIGEEMVELYCKHNFHVNCFCDWLKQKSGELPCPMCKRKISLKGRLAYESGLRKGSHSSNEGDPIDQYIL